MSNIIRAMRGSSGGGGMSDEKLQQLVASITGQRSNLPPELGAEPIGDPALDYLSGPSIASVLLKNAKAITLKNQLEEAQMVGADPEVIARRRAQNEAEMNIYPMIASIKQLDR